MMIFRSKKPVFFLALLLICSSLATFAFTDWFILNHTDLDTSPWNTTSETLDPLTASTPIHSSFPLFNLQSYTAHDPVVINGNSDFASQALNEGWLGNGSSSNPYIIENIAIVNSTDGIYGVSIATTMYFVIRHSYIEMTGVGSSGIFFSSVNNVGTIYNTTLFNNTQYGIYLSSSDGNNITHNLIQNNHEIGINIWASNANIIEYNTIIENTEITGAIKLTVSSYNKINHNNISYNLNGIAHSSSCDFNTYYNNTFSHNIQYSIWSSSFFEYNNISKNDFIYNGDTIIFFQSFTSHNIFSGNMFENNTGEGVRFASSSDNNSIYDNTFTNNTYGLNSNVGASWVYNNTFKGNSYALRILNGFYGVYQNNTIISNGYGIYVWNGDNNTFIDNNVINNSNGIYFTSSDNNTFYGNNFLHNVVQGFSSTSTNYADNGTFGNFWLDHLGMDNDSDGILDTPYALDGLGGVEDNFPLSIWNNETFNPEIINSPTNLTYETHSIGHNLTWRAIDESPDVYEVFFNGSSQGTKTFTSREFFNVSVDGFDLGETNVTVTFRDTDGNIESNTIFVTVLDTIPPNLTSGKVFTFMEDLPDKSINWTLMDLYPWNYTIFKDGVLYANGSWQSGQTIIVNVTSLPLGVYEFILYANDSSSNINSSTHYVVIYDGTAPVVSQPTNISYEYGYFTPPITWIATDKHPENYTVFVDDSEYTNGTWTSGSYIYFDPAGFTPGTYNVTIIVYDTSGLNATSTVFVTVLPDSTIPIVTSPGNQTIAENTSITIVSWTASDYNPTTYEIYQNGVLIQSDIWNNSFPIELIIYDAVVGIYNYTIILKDISNLTTSDTIFVAVEPLVGTAINHPLDITYTEGMTNNLIYWSIISNETGSYTIYQDDFPVDGGNWTNNTLINYSVDNLGPGTYNFTLWVNTSQSYILNDTVFVFVTIDSMAPNISDETDFIILEHSFDNNITWTVSDLNPDIYVIYRNNSIVQSGPWIGTTIVIAIPDLPPRIYNYTLMVYDIRGSVAQDTVFVTILDNTAPIILNSPQNQAVENSTGLILSWVAIDYNPTTYSMVLANGTVLGGTWENYTFIAFVLDDLSLGDHIFTITFSDFYGLTTSSYVTISVVDITSPIISHLPDQTYVEGTASVIITWEISDNDAGAYEIYLDGVPYYSDRWIKNSSVSIDVGNSPAGTYNYTVVVTDYSGNTAVDTVIVTVNKIHPITTDPLNPDPISNPPSSSSTSTTTVQKISPGFEGIFVLALGICYLITRKSLKK
ncbi:MAG: NosD domain-containing protein [Candidatus Thorarchaeota archaeon]